MSKRVIRLNPSEGLTRYTVAAWCSNCGWRGHINQRKGIPIPRRTNCPACGCDEEAETRVAARDGAGASTMGGELADA